MDWQIIGLGVAIIFGLLQFAVVSMPHWITYPGIGIGVLLILWGIISKRGKKKGEIVEEDKMLPPNFKYYEGESNHLYLDVIFNNRPLDLTSKTIAMMVKKDDVAIISKADGDFDKTHAKKGQVSVFLAPADLSQSGSYKGQIMVKDKSGIYKTDPFDFEILPSIIGKVRQLTTTCIAVSVTSDAELQINLEEKKP